MYTITTDEKGFKLNLDGLLLIEHSAEKPFLFTGSGKAVIDMFRGNFSIKDNVREKIALTEFSIQKISDSSHIITLSRGTIACVKMKIYFVDGKLHLDFIDSPSGANRFWLRLHALHEEHIWGCGEQFSYFDLRGKNFPLWTSEQGVGRNKKEYVTWLADCQENAGGDYYWTFYPQPTFVSSRKYFCHIDNSAYMDFDFTNADVHELAVWDKDIRIVFQTGETYVEIVQKISSLLGRQPELPEWVYNGILLGIQGGTDTCINKVRTMIDAGVKVAGIWAQDWEGENITSFGKRLRWNWQWDSRLYPGLDTEIWKLKERGIRFLGYINPYVAKEKPLCDEASRRGYLAKTSSGEDYFVEFGEFHAGVVDFTNREAFEWYKTVIRKELIDFGLDGWMADFGEYLPVDIHLHSGERADLIHNRWPSLWAQCNYEAVDEAGRIGDIIWFMRAGFTGSQKYSPLMWAGDQNVDWSMDDGLASVIPAALSLAMCGHGLSHSDIGGYTTLFHLQRTKELLLRWCEFSAFTPVMRTHEGNRPASNWQFDGDEETIRHFARMTEVYTVLAAYLKNAVKINAEQGIPVMRPLFMHYENDRRCYDIKYQYLLGRDLLVAPVYLPEKNSWNLYLPEDKWIHIWTGKSFSGGDIEIPSAIGYPPVFYREHSVWADIFIKIGGI